MTEPVDSFEARLAFGKLARQLREDAGLKPGAAEAELIAAAGGYASKLSKIETARVAAKVGDVEWMIERYAPSPEDAERLRELAAASRGRATPVKEGVQSREYKARERTCERLWAVYNEIPGVAQTYKFAYATLAKSPLVDEGDVEALARDRAQRGEWIFREDGPEVWMVLGDAALDRMDGGPDVVVEQLRWLQTISRRPAVHLRIIPSDAGSVTGLSNPFTLLNGGPDEWLAFIGHIARNDYIKDDVERFQLVFKNAWDAAVTEDQTEAILEARIADLSKR